MASQTPKEKRKRAEAVVINYGPVVGGKVGQDFSGQSHVQVKEGDIGQQVDLSSGVTIINRGPVYGGQTGQKF